jgi:hypothetical protein
MPTTKRCTAGLHLPPINGKHEAEFHLHRCHRGLQQQQMRAADMTTMQPAVPEVASQSRLLLETIRLFKSTLVSEHRQSFLPLLW